MSASTYPNGINNLVLRGMPLTLLHPGRVFYVGNADVLYNDGQQLAGADTAGKGTFARPFRTLDFAIGQCTANRGDIIMILPGHTETYSTATATSDDLTLDVAGVAIVGLGSGSLKPTFTFDTANTVTVAVTAANVTIMNCDFVANFLSNAIMFTLTTAKNFAMVGCGFSDTSASLNTVNIIESTGAANTVDGLHIENCRASMLGTTFNTFAVLAATARGMTFKNVLVDSIDTADEPAILDVTGIVTDFLMQDCTVGVLGTTNINTLVKVTGTTSTGFITNCYVHTLDTTGVAYTIASNLRASAVYSTGAVASQGGLVNPNQAA